MTALQNLRGSFARLSTREKMLVGACCAAIVGFVMFLGFRWVGGKLSALSRRVERQEEQLGEILKARGKYRQAETRFREIEAMLRRPAPPLRGFLERIAKAHGLNVQEYRDLPALLLGRRKEVEERSIKVYPIKPTLKQIANFMRDVENAREHLLVVKEIRVDRAFDDHDRFQVAEITVSAYSLSGGEAAPAAGPPVRAEGPR
jgi:hypothetical protein